MEQQITVPVRIYLGDIDSSAGPAILSVVDYGPVEIEIPVDLSALGHLYIRFEA